MSEFKGKGKQGILKKLDEIIQDKPKPKKSTNKKDKKR